MSRWLGALRKHQVFFRLSALLWGFAAITFFRSLLDDYYPYYRRFFPLTQMGLIIFAAGFLSAATYKKPLQRSWRGIVFAFLLVATCVAALSYTNARFGHERALLLFAVPLSILSLVLWLELTRHFFFFQSAKLFLIAGVVAGLAAARFLDNPYAAPGVAAAASLASRLQANREWSVSFERLTPLRQLIDLLRYLFLAQAFHAALGQNRQQLLLVLIICSAGLIIPQLIRLLRAVRPHIQQGLQILPLIFIALAALFNFIHYTYWGATAYAVLAVWEAVYFSRSHEVYLKREKILAAACILLAISAYYVSTDWLQIGAGTLVVLVLAGILIYVAKNWRKTITALFALAVFSWVYALQFKYTNSVTRELLRFPVLRLHKPQLPETDLILRMLALQRSSGKSIFTNMLPDGLFLDQAWRTERIGSFDANPATLVLRLAYRCAVRKSDQIYIFDEKSLGIYSEPSALLTLRDMLRQFGRCEIYVADGKNMRPVSNLALDFQVDAKVLQNITPDDAAKLLSVARAEKQQDMMAEAQALYERVYPFYKDDPQFLRELSSLSAARGLIERQIELLNALITLKKDNTVYDKKLLMELYAIKRDRKKSAALAYEILDSGSESPLAMYAFLQRLFADPFDRYEMEALYRKVSAYQPKTDLESIKYAGIKRSMEDLLKQNPTYDRKFQDENHRQEFITFPE
ncbi:MAG: hypothetical protein JNJ69_11730 [Leptospiraceae bacterium]|nr:hypothetical protein [Leptospiraceae bacterium]